MAPVNGAKNPRPGDGMTPSEVTRVIGESKTLGDLRDALDLAGVELSTVELTIKQVLPLANVTERTIRRYVAAGRLIPREVATQNGKQHLFTLADLLAVFELRTELIDRAKSNPLNELSQNVETLAAGFSDVIKAQQVEAQQLREIIEAQGRLIAELRAEQRDTRAQIHQLHETTVKALMPPKKQGWLSRLLRKDQT